MAVRSPTPEDSCLMGRIDEPMHGRFEKKQRLGDLHQPRLEDLKMVKTFGAPDDLQ